MAAAEAGPAKVIAAGLPVATEAGAGGVVSVKALSFSSALSATVGGGTSFSISGESVCFSAVVAFSSVFFSSFISFF